MSRIHRFIVEMEVPDDDQTDPEDLFGTMEQLLDADPSTMADWRQFAEDMNPEYRPKFKVRGAPSGSAAQNLADRVIDVVKRMTVDSLDGLRLDIKRKLEEMDNGH